MEKKTKSILFIIIVVLVALVLGVSCIVYVYYSGMLIQDHPTITMDFIQDTNSGTLTVKSIETQFISGSLNWEGFRIDNVHYSGNATFPSGTVDIDDVITNCTGNICLICDTYNIIIGYWDFT